MEIDHIFFAVRNKSIADSVANLMVQAGFTQGAGNTHQGQGTVNHRFFYQNGFIELLYPDGGDGAASNIKKLNQKPMYLYQRVYGKRGASEFGICFRPNNSNEINAFTSNHGGKKYGGNGESGDKVSGLATWSYKLIYVPDSIHIPIAIAPIHEPMWFYLDVAKAPSNFEEAKQQPLVHKNQVQILTQVQLYLSKPYSSFAVTISQNIENLIICQSDPSEPSLIIIFDKYIQGKQLDLNPYVDVVLKW